MRSFTRWLKTLLLVAVVVTATGCASTGSAPDAKDPWESMNRSILEFNLASDRIFLKPIAKGYSQVVPAPVRKGVSNFFNNLWEPWTIVNDLLQGKFADAGHDFWRFAINLTFGIGGIFDVASHAGVPDNDEDVGQSALARIAAFTALVAP